MQTRAETGGSTQGSRHVQDHEGRPADHPDRAVHLRQVARPDLLCEEARRDRVHASEGVIPAALWRVLYFIAAVIVVYMLFFADSGERASPSSTRPATRLGQNNPLPCNAQGQPQ